MTAAVTRLEIDLSAVAANWRALCALHPSGAVAGVLKADGYGLGAAQVARRLWAEGCRTFFVAHLAEALALRPHVPGARLVALNGLWPGDEAAYAETGVVPTLGSLGEIAAWSAEAGRRGQALPAFLHIDTGMNRLGLPADELVRLAGDPGLLRGIAVLFHMTHLAAAEDPADPANKRQRAAFGAACERLPPAPRSLANSSGIFLGFGSELARPGAALYGINPTPCHANPMQGVARLLARVLQVRHVAAGETVGYNGTWVAPRPSRIATVSVGYADGLPRGVAGGTPAAFDGAPVPLVGRVSMDLTTYDVTAHPALGPGSWLELLGPACPVDAMAAACRTNGYEVLTRLGARYARSYLGGDAA